MTYDANLTFTEISNLIRASGNDLNRALDQAKELFEDLRVFKDGRSNADIATALGVTTAAVDHMEAAVTSMRDIARAADGVNIAAKAYRDDWRKFTP